MTNMTKTKHHSTLRHFGKKSKSQKRKTRKQKPTQRKKAKRVGGNREGDRTFYFVASESLSRPGYPIMQVISTYGDGMGGFMSFEKYLSDLTYEIEDQLLAITNNRANKKIPKNAVVKKIVIRNPIYVPQPKLDNQRED